MRIFLSRNSAPHGPYTEAEVRDMLKHGEATVTDAAIVEGGEEWSTIAAVLAIKIPPPAPPLIEERIPPPHESQTAVQRQLSQQPVALQKVAANQGINSETEQKKRGFLWLVDRVFIVLVILAAIITCLEIYKATREPWQKNKPAPAAEAPAEIASGEWIYELNTSNEASIVGYTGAGGAVEFPSEIDGYPVTQIGDGTYPPTFGDPNTTFKSVTFPVSVTNIAIRAFQNCRYLTNVVIGNGVTEVGAWAFAQCVHLERVTIPDSVKVIGSGAFLGCHSLNTVIIGNGVTELEGNVFEGCTFLKNVIAPRHLKDELKENKVPETANVRFTTPTTHKIIMIFAGVGVLALALRILRRILANKKSRAS